MPMQNPLFSYKVHLLSLGDRIQDKHMDRTEAAMLCAISMTSIGEMFTSTTLTRVVWYGGLAGGGGEA